MKIEILGGETISSACNQAVNTAKIHGCSVEFDFNEILLTAEPTTDPEELVKFYLDELNRRSEAYHASPEYKKLREDAATKDAERRAMRDTILAIAPATMTLRDEVGWAKAKADNTDLYGAAVMTYAERWARLMESQMEGGHELTEIAEKCSHLADDEGITGFMYGCAVGTLSAVWIHGEVLRLWHNKTTQLHGEGDKANENGGVLNPALLCIGK